MDGETSTGPVGVTNDKHETDEDNAPNKTNISVEESNARVGNSESKTDQADDATAIVQSGSKENCDPSSSEHGAENKVTDEISNSDPSKVGESDFSGRVSRDDDAARDHGSVFFRGTSNSGVPPSPLPTDSDVKPRRVILKDAGDVLEAAMAQLGHFRLYQKYVMLMLCIPNLFSAMYSLNYVFVADQVPFRCLVPECESSSTIFENPAAEALVSNQSCRRFRPLDELAQTCDRIDFHATETVECTEIVYENNDTIFAEFGLACREWLRTLVGSVRNAALPVALLLTGYISDSFGRRTAFCIFSACAGVMGIIKACSVSYNMYITMEFFEAALGYGFNSAAYVMMVEFARPSLRAAFACATGMAYGLGGVLFALIAWQVPYWRHLLWTIHTPALLLPLYWYLIDESPRWLHATGKADQASVVIRKAAKWNKIMLDEKVMQALENEIPKQKESPKQRNPWLSLIKSRVLMMRFAICSFCWIASTFVYYGLTINSVSLSGDKYVNFALNMSMEIVASLLLMMILEKFGRKKSIFGAFLLCGVACVTPYFVSHTGTSLGLFFLGKLAITFAFNSVYVFTAELFPTHTRSSALAACSLVGRIGSILAPQTPLLNLYVQALLYATCSLLAAIAVVFVPETRRTRLPQHVDDAVCMRGEPVMELGVTTPPPPQPRVLSADT